MTLNVVEHNAILMRLLTALFEDTVVGPLLGFKGGTAAVIFYGLNRFSVDLDFDLLAVDQADGVFERVKTILEMHGTVKQAQKKRYTLFFLLSYHDEVKDGQNVKVEISTRNLEAHYQELEFFGMPLKVMVEEDMVACKLIALHQRIGKANRDIFDVWYFLDKKWSINKELLERRTGYRFTEFLDLCIQDLEQMSDQGILAGLGELLTAKQKIWVKRELRRKTIQLLKLARMSDPIAITS